MWHALLLLLQHAIRLHCVSLFISNEPLVVCALSRLLSITSLGVGCRWPLSFAAFIARQSEHITCNNSSASDEFKDKPRVPHPGQEVIQLTDGLTEAEMYGTLKLRPHSHLFAAYQRSLSDQQQAVLARWAAGSFRSGDEQVSAAESSTVSLPIGMSATFRFERPPELRN